MHSDLSRLPSVILETVHLSRAVGGQVLVDDVSIQVHAGDVLAIVGPSGAGKSSFLRLLNRLDEPTGGTVLLEGQDYRELMPQVLRRRVGMVMQLPYLFAGTVADNILFGPRQRDEELPRGQLESLLQRVGLAGYAGRNSDTLSVGEAQRVSLARTLANQPDLLLLDEPTSALDPGTRRDVEALICSIIRDQGLTCLIVTHDAEQAVRMADRAAVLDGGRLVRTGPAEEVVDA